MATIFAKRRELYLASRGSCPGVFSGRDGGPSAPHAGPAPKRRVPSAAGTNRDESIYTLRVDDTSASSSSHLHPQPQPQPQHSPLLAVKVGFPDFFPLLLIVRNILFASRNVRHSSRLRPLVNHSSAITGLLHPDSTCRAPASTSGHNAAPWPVRRQCGTLEPDRCGIIACESLPVAHEIESAQGEARPLRDPQKIPKVLHATVVSAPRNSHDAGRHGLCCCEPPAPVTAIPYGGSIELRPDLPVLAHGAIGSCGRRHGQEKVGRTARAGRQETEMHAPRCSTSTAVTSA